MFLKKIKRKIYKLLHPAIGEVLMMHRVVNQRSVLEDNRLMEVTPDFLEKTIVSYKQKGYDLISLDELQNRLISDNKKGKKFVCFTLDDGYEDNYTQAYSVFKKHNCPFAIYLTTDFPDYKALMWWYVLEDILIHYDKIILGDGSEYICNTFELKNQVFRIVREIIFALQTDNMEVKLDELFANYSYSFVEIAKKNALDWKQIIELSKDTLCTIGSHTVTHAALDKLNDIQAYKELQQSKETIEKHINNSVMHFAYPYGRVSDEVVEMISKIGYKTATLANGGNIRNKGQINQIKRVQLTEY